MPRTPLRTVALALCALAVPFVAVTALAEGSDKCTIATKGDSPTAKACKTGGRKEAGKVMKQMVRTAKAKGVKFTCDDCHKDMETFELTTNAKTDFEKLLAAQK